MPLILLVEYRGKKIRVNKSRGLLTLNLDNEFILNIEEIEGLDKLTELQKLSIQNGMITEIKGLENLRNLEILNLSHNRIFNIEGLENVTNLRSLNLQENLITEIKRLQNLKKLKHLNLSENPVHNWAVKYFGGKKQNGEFKYAQRIVEFCEKIIENDRIQEERISSASNNSKS